jgi:hypothetical protein
VPFGSASSKAPLEAAAAGELARAVAAEERAYASQRAQISLARGNAESAERDALAAEAQAGLLRERMTLLEKAFTNGELSLQEILRERIGAADVETSVRSKEVALGHALARLRQSLSHAVRTGSDDGCTHRSTGLCLLSSRVPGVMLAAAPPRVGVAWRARA